jgi:hypothetical protein
MLIKNNMLDQILNTFCLIAKSIIQQDNKVNDHIKNLVEMCSNIKIEDMDISEIHIESIMKSEQIGKEDAKRYIYSHLQLFLSEMTRSLLALGRMSDAEQTALLIEGMLDEDNRGE